MWDWISFSNTGIAALLGTGFGALAVFWIEDRKRLQRLEDARVEATNVAIFALSRAFRDTESLRLMVDSVRDSPLRWYTLGVGQFNAPPAPFDATALAFLFETAHPNLPARVQFELDRYADLRENTRHRFLVHVEQVQPRMEQFDHGGEATAKQLEEMVGPRLHQILQALTDGIVTTVDELTPALHATALELRATVRALYPKRTIIRFEPINAANPVQAPVATVSSARNRFAIRWGWPVACHAMGLLLEISGSLLIFLEARRMIAQLQAAGHADYTGGPPPGYQDWIYDAGRLGFGLLLSGIILAGLALALEGWRQMNKGRPAGGPSP